MGPMGREPLPNRYLNHSMHLGVHGGDTLVWGLISSISQLKTERAKGLTGQRRNF